MSKFCILGYIFNDVTLKSAATPVIKMRLGGIVHAARGMYAVGEEYSVAYFAPSYLDSHIEHYLKEIGCTEVIKLGNVTNSPNTVLIQEVQEVGDQGYNFLLNENVEVVYDDSQLAKLDKFEKILLFAGDFDMSMVMRSNTHAHYYLDVTNDVESLADLGGLHFRTLFLSTSSSLFKNDYSNIDSLVNDCQNICEQFVLKENRGGSRAYDYAMKKFVPTASMTVPVVHSVGVGDVFDTIVAIYDQRSPFEYNLLNASYVAAEYAQTTFIDEFRTMAQHYLNLPIEDKQKYDGVFLPWDVRKGINIYIAAPDFDFVDTKPIDFICQALEYHNFTPRRPIKENGQMSKEAGKTEKQKLFQSDMALIDSCQIMLAVLLFYDPGTLIEIGVAAERGMPVLVYDPYSIAENCMLTEIPNVVSVYADQIISELFKYASIIWKQN